MPPILQLQGIRKEFPGVLALDDVSFDLNSGEIHALMGENGAGKSTLIKVMTGVYQPDQGEIVFNGTKVRPRSTQESVEIGISTVYQEVNLVPNLTIGENVCLGRESRAWYGIDWKSTHQRAEKALLRLGLQLDTRQPLSSVSIAFQQLVAIARALDVDAKVLVLDEPTSSLDATETRQLFDRLTILRDDGLGIVFITHFLDQVFQITDRTTVMRNGRRVSTENTKDITKLKLVNDMIGSTDKSLSHTRQNAPEAADELLVEVENGATKSGVSNVAMQLHKGEAVGLAGLLGSGRTETLNFLFGLDHRTKGAFRVNGANKTKWTVSNAIASGFALCPEDRKAEGIFPNLSVESNLTIGTQVRKGLWRRVKKAEVAKIVEDHVKALQIKVANTANPIRTLSGGNQQKVVLSRWLATNPKILLLDEPTRGVDVGAKFEIMNLVDKMKQQGMAIVFVSSELEETVQTCDRAYVLRDRQMVGEIQRENLNEETIVKKIAEESS